MRKLKVATIVFLAGTGVCLCALLVLALSRGGLWFGMGGNGNAGAEGTYREGSGLGGYALVLEKEVAPEGISSLKVDYGMNSNDVYFYQGEGESVVVREYMNFTPNEKQISGVEEKDGGLLIKGARRSSFGFFFVHTKDAYTEIYLPAGFIEQLENVNIKTVSGEILSDIPFAAKKAFSFSSTSGDIWAEGQEKTLDTYSGRNLEFRAFAGIADAIL